MKLKRQNEPAQLPDAASDAINMAIQALDVLANKLDTKQGHEISEDAIRGLEKLRAKLRRRPVA